MATNDVLAQVDVSHYLGEWVVICDDRVVAHHRDLTKLDHVIEQCSHTPTIAKIPKERTLIF